MEAQIQIGQAEPQGLKLPGGLLRGEGDRQNSMQLGLCLEKKGQAEDTLRPQKGKGRITALPSKE